MKHVFVPFNRRGVPRSYCPLPRLKLLFSLFAMLCAYTTSAQIITTVAGNGTSGSTGDGSLATAAQLGSPLGIAFDATGNYYFVELNTHRVRKVNIASGIITTVAGNGTGGYSGDGGQATSAQLYNPYDIAVDAAGSLYIADHSNTRIRKVNTATGVITTVAGNGTFGYSGDGGQATSAQIYAPTGVAVDGAGNLYISDRSNNRVRKVNASTGIITTIAGNGVAGYSGDGGAATSAMLRYPWGIEVDAAGNLYIADESNQRVRKVDVATGVITTVAGSSTSGYSGDGGAATSAQLRYPTDVAVDGSGNLYIADRANYRIRKVNAATGVITTVAGTGAYGDSGDNGAATSAKLASVYGIAIDNTASNLYISVYDSYRVRKVDVYAVSLSETKSISCAGDATGELTATVTGGTGPYSYSWSPGGSTSDVISNLTAGTYTVTVTDAFGATTTATKTIAVNDTEKPVFTAPADITKNVGIYTNAGTKTVNLPNNNQYAGGSPAVLSFQDPLPAGAVITGYSITYTVYSPYLAAVSPSLAGTGLGDFHPNNETKTLTVNSSTTLPNYVYGGTNHLTIYSWWNGIYFRGGTITLNYATLDTNVCEASVSVPSPAVSDNCGGVILTNNFNGTADASGFYPKGVTNVVWTATDGAGNSETFTQKVTVVDNIKPTVTAPVNITVNTDAGKNTASGVVLGTPVTADNCEVGTTTSNAPATFPLGETIVTWTVTDAVGNSAIATQVVTVVDKEGPVLTIATLPTITGQCSATATAPTATDYVDGTVTGTTTDPLTYTTQGTYTINWTYTDAAGNTSTQQQTVTVKDTQKPTVVTQNITVNLDATGNATITAAQINNGSTDNCSIPAIGYSLDKSTFTCDNIGANTVTLTVTDNNGNVSTATAIVTVEDKIAPVAIAKNITVQLDASGMATITPAMVDDGSSDNCSISSMSLSKTTFDCSNIGTNSVTLTVNDAAGNDRMIPQGLIGHWDFDGSNPKADLTGNWGDLILNSSATITSGKLNVVNGSIARTSSYAGQTITSKTLVSYVSINNLNVRSGSAMTIDRIATDEFDGIVYAENQLNKWMNGSSIARRTIDLTPGFAETVPNQLVMMAITYENVAGGKVQITLYRNGVSIGSYLANNATSWSAGNAEIIFGARHFNNNAVIGGMDAKIDEAMIFNRALSASEIASLAGKVNQATAIITVEDNIAPKAIAKNITVTLDATGKATIAAADVNNGSSDNCGIETLVLSTTAFDCSNVGENTVTLTVTDKSGNAHEATAIVTVVDNTLPIALAKNITVQLDATGNATIVAGDINNGSSDACGIKSMTLNKTTFDCANVGDNSVILTITDNNGNVATATAIVKVEDKVIPVAKAQNVTIELDANGVATITATAVDNGSTDACGAVTLALSKTTFGCANVGANTVTLTVTDKNGNEATVEATVTVVDNVAPVALAKNITVQLDATGNATITAAQVNNGSSDNCGIKSMSLDKMTFDCSQVGENIVTLTVTDVNNNTHTTTAIVTVEDKVAPVVITQNITVQLDAAGNATITAADINNGSSDACGIKSMSLDKTTFDCSSIGANTVILTVTDNNGNVATKTAIVTIEDKIAPIALTKNITIKLDAAGKATIVAADVNNGSSDVCGAVKLTIDKTAFDCSNIGENEVTLTVTDANGNVASEKAVVTIVDDLAPVVITQNITVKLDATGNATITTAQINNGSTDNCGIATMELNVTEFTCENVGVNTVTLTVTDVNGNVATKEATVTIVDEIAPTAIAKNITAALDANGSVTITAAQVNDNSSDNCGVETLALDTDTFGCSNLGENTVSLTVIDKAGNTAIAAAIVTIVDNIAPTITAPADLVLDVDAGKTTASNVTLGTPVTADNCDAAAIVVTNDAPTEYPAGTTIVTWTATDASGNKTTATQTLTVRQDIAAVASLTTINVPIRTAYANVPLPATVEVTYTNGQKEAISVTWAQGNYNGMVAGMYTLTGQLIPAPNTTNRNSKVATISVVVEPNKAPTALAFSATTFKPDAKADDVIGTLTTTDPDDTQFVYTLVAGEGDTDNSLFEIRGDNVYLKSNNGLSGQTQFTFRVRSTDPYQNTIEKAFILSKGNYGVAEDKLKIVNAFSPNNDGINDTWFIPELRFYNSVEVEVFDRSGVRLFHTTDPEKGWDGRGLNGQILKGAFFYIVQVKDINLVKKGVVTIISK